MTTLRLIDPDGYTVPDSLRENVPTTDLPAVREELLTTAASQHAAQWADFGYRAAAYQVVTDPAPAPQEASTA